MRYFLFISIILISSIFSNNSLAGLSSSFVEAALSLENPNVRYDGGYSKISYPMGDVPPNIGVCSDVIIRAYRLIGIDLQQLVHEDMKENFALYPKIWGLKSTDRNIDHRRVPNLRIFFERYGEKLAISSNPKDYKPGDIVTWNLRERGSLPHIGIIVDKIDRNTKNPMVIHNIGGGQVIEDMVFDYKITGHYRYGLE